MVYAHNSSKIFLKKRNKQRKNKANKTKSCLNPQGFLKPLKMWYIFRVGLQYLCLFNRGLLHLIVIFVTLLAQLRHISVDLCVI